MAKKKEAKPKTSTMSPIVPGKLEELDMNVLERTDGAYSVTVVSVLQQRQLDGTLKKVHLVHKGTAKIVVSDQANSPTRLAPHFTMLDPPVVAGAPFRIFDPSSDMSQLSDLWTPQPGDYVLPFGHCYAEELTDEEVEKFKVRRGAPYEILHSPNHEAPIYKKYDTSRMVARPTEETVELGFGTEYKPTDEIPEISEATNYYDNTLGRDDGLGWYGEKLRATHRLCQSFPYYMFENPDNGATMELFYTPPGKFVMGSDVLSDEEKPAHTINMSKGTYMGRYPLLVGEFRKFVAATGYKTDREKEVNNSNDVSWKQPGFPIDDQHPVVLVTLNDVQQCANWMGLKIPTEHQWEYAARGCDSRPFPWGYDPPSDKLLIWSGSEISRQGTERCGTVPAGRSPWGGDDMAGNAWEWTCSEYAKYPQDAPTPGEGYWKRALFAATMGDPKEFFRYDEGHLNGAALVK